MIKKDNIIEARAANSCCANCGKAELDDVKLKDCHQCDLARYCGDECQQDHLEKHEAICEERAAELREELLFRQPESSHFGDCPICFLPLPLEKSMINTCCCKHICFGCAHANRIREIEQRLKHRCPFCRKLFAKTDEETDKMLMKRAEVNDPLALVNLGAMHYNKGDRKNGLKFHLRAAELGNAVAHSALSGLYRRGEGVRKDEKRAVYHMEEAAIAGHPNARYNLGVYEWNKERIDRALKHWIIAANLGHNDSLGALKQCYKFGHVSKDDLAAALRSHQAAVDATKSPQREKAEKIISGESWVSEAGLRSITV